MIRVLVMLSFLLVCWCRGLTQVNRFDVLITEIMADPSPAVGLPNAEYVEIRNHSLQPVNLLGWKLGDGSSSATITTNIILAADSFLVLCSNTSVAALSAYGRALGISSFPSLDNNSDQLSIRSQSGIVIHAVAYDVGWYDNAVKQEGGWSLEMIDMKNPCSGKSNWKASTDAKGGTPGKRNSVEGINPDLQPPGLIRTYTIDSVTIVAMFDESLDSNSAGVISNYKLEGMTIAGAFPQAPKFQAVKLSLTQPLLKRKIYALTANFIKDCSGNTIAAFNNARAGFHEPVQAPDLVINEILFNPKPGGFDFIELYNNSTKILDASSVYIANRNSTGIISSLKQLSESPFQVFPGDHIVVTEDPLSLNMDYLVREPENVLSLSSMPSFPDDKGIVVVCNSTGDLLDELNYDEDWHFALIDNKEGISLERLDPGAATGNRNNWHSASFTSGYGTPTSRNSQYKSNEIINGMIYVDPKTFSPDNDGINDVATISYNLSEPGYVANVNIFDAHGRCIRRISRNDLLGLHGKWNWDGLDDKGAKLATGIYIIYTELFNLQGKQKVFKNSILLARRSPP